MEPAGSERLREGMMKSRQAFVELQNEVEHVIDQLAAEEEAQKKVLAEMDAELEEVLKESDHQVMAFKKEVQVLEEAKVKLEREREQFPSWEETLQKREAELEDRKKKDLVKRQLETKIKISNELEKNLREKMKQEVAVGERKKGNLFKCKMDEHLDKLETTRKAEQLEEILKKVEEQQKMADVGVSLLEKKKKEHCLTMQEVIKEANQKAVSTQTTFAEALVREIEKFKLPSLKTLYPKMAQVEDRYQEALAIFEEVETMFEQSPCLPP